LQIAVEEINWDLPFSSHKLRKLAVMSATPLSISEAEIRPVASRHNLNVSAVTVFGTKNETVLAYRTECPVLNLEMDK
jgi:hypothetical protein